MRRLIDHFELFNQMSSIQRFSRDHMLKPENVLEHTGFVVLFCYFVAEAMDDHLTEGHTFHMGSLLSKAVIHDVDEGVFGDIPRPTKYMSAVTATEFKEAERRAISRLSEYFKFLSLKADWERAKDRSPEGRLVAIADLAACVYKLWAEVHLFGNRSFARVGRELNSVLRDFRKTIRFEWEVPIVNEIELIVQNLRYENHPELSSQLNLGDMLKEEAK